MTPVPGPRAPRHLKAAYLAPPESLQRECLGTPWFYFPGPVLVLLVAVFLDYAAQTVRFSSLPTVPGLSWGLAQLPTAGPYAPAIYLSVLFLGVTALGVIWLMIRYLRWVSTVYAVTTNRLIVQRGIIARDLNEVPLLQVRGIDVHQTIPDRLFGFGTLLISSEGGNRPSQLGNEAWKGVPRPFDLQRTIETASQTLARDHGAGATPATTPPVAPPSRELVRPGAA